MDIRSEGVPAKRPLVPFCGRIIALLGDRAFHDDCQRQRLSDTKEVCEAEARQAGEEMRSCLVWSKVSPKLVREPEPLSLLSRGITNNVGYIVSIDLWEIPFLPLQFNWAQNSPFMKVFPPFDFSAVLSVMISLLALVFSYDAVTREREEGTLRFIFSSSVSRHSFLLGKWLGVVLTVLPILLACFLLALGLVVLGGGIRFRAANGWA